TLVLHLTPNAMRKVTLTIDNALKVSNDEAAAVLNLHTEANFLEKVQASNVLRLNYRKVNAEAVDLRGQKHPRRNFDKIKSFLPSLVTLLQLDAVGNIISQQLDASGLRGVSPEQYKELKDFHESIQQAFEALSVSLPARGTVKPGESWKAERHL